MAIVGETVLPNIRKLFIPDPGYVIFDVDLAGADAQVFAKETGDEALLEDFRQKKDIHKENAAFMFGSDFTSQPEDSHAYYIKRQQCKHAVHATHNVGSPDALVRHSSIAWSRQQAQRFQNYWFQKHPRIRAHFNDVQRQLETTRSVSNRFGYRIIFFDRIDQLLPAAIPWVNQSTVAEICFRGGIQLEERCPYVELLLQVHDSLVFQIPKEYHHAERWREMRAALTVVVPYDDPLVIPWGFSCSEVSWGDCAPLIIP